jgi:hypothetical protein
MVKGSNNSNINGFHGSDPSARLAVTTPSVASPGFLNPLAPYQIPPQLGDTVYIPIGSLFDPRTIDATTTGAVTARFSHITPTGLQSPVLECLDILRSKWQVARPGRNLPTTQQLFDMLETIIDISRMLTIFYSAGSMVNLDDQSMRRRARTLLAGREYFADMQSLLSRLPFPGTLLSTISRFIGCTDVSDTNEFQYVGFLAIGGFNQFSALYTSVRTRSEALANLRLLYPELGLLENQKMPAWDADLFQLFSNAVPKIIPTDEGFAPYVIESGSSDISVQIQSAGILMTTYSGVPSNATDGSSHSGLTGVCNTAFALPGDANYAYVRTPSAHLTVWDPITNLDSAITYGNAGSYSATVLSPLRIAAPNITANVVHEYNMMQGYNATSMSVNATNASNAIVVRNLANENVWARVSGSSTLSRISWNFQRNHLEGLHTMLM